MTIEEHVPLAPLTTFRLGGPARFFVRVSTADELRESLEFAEEKKLNTLLLGGGSNILVGDAGFDGLVIKMEVRGIEQQKDVLVAGAGEVWDTLVARAVDAGLWGIENLSGVPGTVGGAVVQNIGAYGAALSQTLVWVEVFDTQTGEVCTLQTRECFFSYRTSIFKQEPGRYVVLRAAFKLATDVQPNMEYRDPTRAYKDLSRVLAGNETPSLSDMRTGIVAIRAEKFPDLSVEGTAGSFFLNPVLSADKARALQSRFPDLPLFVMPETSDIKVPLGWILDHVLHLRGYALGGVRLFEKQALVLVASHGATAHAVRAFAEYIKKEVKEKIQIEIEEEVRMI